MVRNKYGHECFDPTEFHEDDLKNAYDMRSDRLSRGTLITCEFCDTFVWLDDKHWDIVTCEDPKCTDKAIRRYCV